MKKKINSEYFDFPVSESGRQEIEQCLQREKIIYQAKEDLYCKGIYKSFFDHYDEETIHPFIEEYAAKKAFYLMQGEKLLHEEETNQFYFRNLAENYIWEIQQKKLFDLQCMWRAEKIILREVQVTKDFSYFEATIKNCNLIEPVTRDEMQLYIDYLLSEDYCDKEHYFQWQEYDFIKNQSLMFCNSGIPAWYTYYDKHVHSKNMHDYADIKGEKEFFYINLLNKGKSVQRLYDEVAGKNEIEEKPPLQLNFKTLEFFIATFEDKSLLKYFYASEKLCPESQKNEELDAAIKLLKNSDEEIFVHAGNNWKDALIESSKYYKTKKIAEALLAVYDEYTMRIKTNLSFNDDSNSTRQQIILRNLEQYKKQILQARKMNGESADFNF